MGTAFAKTKRYEDAMTLFDKVIGIAPDYFLAWSNRGNLLSDQRLSDDAVRSYKKALELNPQYSEGWSNYGNTLFSLGRFEEARTAHEEALKIDPNFGEAWSNYGNTLLELKLGDEAFHAYERAYKVNPMIPYLMGQYFAAKRNQCIWDESPSAEQLLNMVTGGHKVTIPFNLLQTDSSLALQRVGAETFSKDRFPISRTISRDQSLKSCGQKLRIGYFSSDLREHPVGILMQGLLELHDRSRFEVYGFFLNPKTGDPLEKQLLQAFDQTFDLYGLSDLSASDLIFAQSLDIAIDLNGHTSGARTALFASKIAPIQVSYLGYAGTSGADFYDALIADKVAIPPDQQVHFSEEIAYLPNSFFPVDTSISYESFGEMPTRPSQGLPQSGFIFTCFNNSYKITPEIFEVWMSLLKEIPNSVLWLSKPSAMAIQNLQSEAKSRSVDPSRLIFASRTPGRKEHLSRLRLADLFLDTPNYNAHATAADALWAGLPILTLIGETFAGRVAASQLNALGLDQLIVNSKQEYFNKAVELASRPDLLKNIRIELESKRSTSPLFDTKQYVKDLESIYFGLLSQSS
jgi:predicted O-linked N-acetylglucosamine transferase (SPINDLY family)